MFEARFPKLSHTCHSDAEAIVRTYTCRHMKRLRAGVNAARGRCGLGVPDGGAERAAVVDL